MKTQGFLRSFGIGAVCGLRSMTGPAVVRWRAGDPVRLGFAALAVGELIADKLPMTPPRTFPPALIFRALAGGFAGSSIATATDDDRLAAAIAGATGAVAAAYAGMALRAAIVHGLRLPDPLVACAEDALAIGGALAVSRP